MQFLRQLSALPLIAKNVSRCLARCRCKLACFLSGWSFFRFRDCLFELLAIESNATEKAARPASDSRVHEQPTVPAQRENRFRRKLESSEGSAGPSGDRCAGKHRSVRVEGPLSDRRRRMLVRYNDTQVPLARLLVRKAIVG